VVALPHASASAAARTGVAYTECSCRYSVHAACWATWARLRGPHCLICRAPAEAQSASDRLAHALHTLLMLLVALCTALALLDVVAPLKGAP
jgi:hypothetical protein